MLIVLYVLLSLAFAADTVLLDRSLPEGSLQRGSWNDSLRGVHLSRGAPGALSVLLPPGPDLTDSRIRAEVTLGREPHLTVLARVTHPNDLRALSGIGLTLYRDRVQWERWDHGVGLPIAPPVPTAGAISSRTVQVELHITGDRFEGTVRDQDGAAVLAKSTVSDPRWAWGRVGLRAHDDAYSTIARLTVEGLPLSEDAPRPSGEAAPRGEERFALLPRAQLARLPPGTRGAVLGTWPYDDSDRVGLRLTADQLDRIERAELPVEVQPLVPFWARDASVRAAARKVPTQGDRPDLGASYKDPSMVEAIVRRWARDNPDRARAYAIGTSHQGRAIVALRITRNPTPDLAPAVLLLGGVHGDDLMSTELALDAAHTLLHGEPAASEPILRALDVWVVPLLNPDGNHALHAIGHQLGRKNGRPPELPATASLFGGVDPARNFPFAWGHTQDGSSAFVNSPTYRGPSAASEPETQALIDMAEQRRFIAALTYRSPGSAILVPYSVPGFKAPVPDVASGIATQIFADLPRSGPDAITLSRRRRDADGNEQDWLRHTYGTVAFTVRGHHRNPTDPAVRQRSIEAVRPVTRALLERVVAGPRLTGRVVDRQGRPLQAQITTNSERWQADERWTSRPADGRFHRMLATPGPVQVTARRDGFRPATTRVDAQGPTAVELVMDVAP